MHPIRLIVPAALAFVLAGCDKAEAPTPTATASPPTSSVATPPENMPKSDAAIPPPPPNTATSSGDSNNPAQSSPKELGKEQESASMPLPGQVNNHSTPPVAGESKAK